MIEKAKRQERDRKHKIVYSKLRRPFSWIAVILGVIVAVGSLLAIRFHFPFLDIGIACIGVAIAILAIINLSGPTEPTEVDRTIQRMLDRSKPGNLP